MKVNINNKTNLPFKIIGDIYDKYINYDYYDTLYQNKVDCELFSYKKRGYKMEIKYKISCICITVEELDIFAKDVSMKNVKFPRLPKKKY